MTVELRGADKFQERLAKLRDGEASIERATVVAGCIVMSDASKAAAPGSIKQECGFYVRRNGDRAVGKVGLMKFPRRGDGQNGPHGIYLEHGTKYITARRFIRSALQASRARAEVAMRQAAQRKIKQTAGS